MLHNTHKEMNKNEEAAGPQKRGSVIGEGGGVLGDPQKKGQMLFGELHGSGTRQLPIQT